MSRVAKAPITVPKGVEVSINGQDVALKGGKGILTLTLHPAVGITCADDVIKFTFDQSDRKATAQAGTARALVNNMVTGVSEGFEKKLQLVGVGYRAQIKGSVVHLNLGLSHPIEHALPNGVTAECPSQTEIVLKGADKQLVNQVAAVIRDYRRPEPYKGKGVRYADERVRMKEAKKK